MIIKLWAFMMKNEDHRIDKKFQEFINCILLKKETTHSQLSATHAKRMKLLHLSYNVHAKTYQGHTRCMHQVSRRCNIFIIAEKRTSWKFASHFRVAWIWLVIERAFRSRKRENPKNITRSIPYISSPAQKKIRTHRQ